MKQQLIQTTRDGAVAIVMLSSPDTRNALTADMRDALIAEMDRLMIDKSCRAIVLAGSDSVFCAGGDLKSMVGTTVDSARHRLMAGHRLVRLIAEGPKPVLTAVEGAAFGAGMSIAALSDLCITASDAKFGSVFGKVGLVPDWGWLWAVPMRVGLGRARRIAMLGEVVRGGEAVQIGLADVVAAPGKARAVAIELAQRYAAAATLAIASAKSAFCRHTSSLDEVLAFEVSNQSTLMTSGDHIRARDAFFAKETPVFEGN